MIVLDEPLTGLDPRQRRHMTDLFHELGDPGCCVIVSSHVLEEVERFGSNVLVIVQGRLAAEGDFRAIRDLMDDRPHRLRLRTDRPQQVAGRLLADGLIMGLELDDERHGRRRDRTRCTRFRRQVAAVARDAAPASGRSSRSTTTSTRVFRYLVGR